MTLLSLFCSALALAAPGSFQDPGGPPPALLLDAPAASTAQQPQSPMIGRQRTVLARTGLVTSAEALAGSAGRLLLELFDGERIVARLERVEPAWGGGRIWIGEVEGDPLGSVILSEMQGVLAGSIRSGARLYSLGYAGDGLHRLTEIDESQAPVCATGPEQAVTLPPPPRQGLDLGRQAAGAAGPAVDVMVVYTTLAKNAQGGTAAMESLINLAVVETNQGYKNSDVNQRLRLVHSAELVGYVENGNFSTELSRLRNPGDGYIDEVHPWRNQYGADMVAMIVNSTQYCGIAYLMTSVSPAFASNAFSVTSRTCATGYYSFGHELGHNMGCHHDRANASQGAYPYSYGYRTTNGAWRTVLAYSPGTRILYFSNPNKSFGGYPLGVAHPASNSAENWMTLNNTASTTSAFRAAIGPELEVFNLIAGQTVNLRLSRATPEGDVYFAWSTTGGGPTMTTFGLADLSPPIQSQLLTASTSGVANYFAPVPAAASGRSVWLQGADVLSATLSNSIATSVQ